MGRRCVLNGEKSASFVYLMGEDVYLMGRSTFLPASITDYNTDKYAQSRRLRLGAYKIIYIFIIFFIAKRREKELTLIPLFACETTAGQRTGIDAKRYKKCTNL